MTEADKKIHAQLMRIARELRELGDLPSDKHDAEWIEAAAERLLDLTRENSG